MNLFFCDASAMGKRYVPELGSAIVNHLFASVSHDRLVMLTQALGELLSILVRRRNQGVFSQGAYQNASLALRVELIAAGQLRLLASDDALVYASLPLIEQHSINATDALVLAAALGLVPTLTTAGSTLVFLASDVRLLRAAASEGLAVFNPETGTSGQLDLLIDAT